MADQNAADRLRGLRMGEDEIAAFLTERGTGVLALADGDDAYAVPISFGYEDGRVYFAFFRFDDEPRKETYAEATRTACLAVYDAESPQRWRSVLALGPIHPVSPDRWDEVGEALGETAWSPDLSTVGSRQQTVGTYVLTVEEATGMKGSAYG